MKHDIYAEFWDARRRGANFPKIERRIDDTYQKIKLASLHLTTKENKEWARENKFKRWVKTEYTRKTIKTGKDILKELAVEDAQDSSLLKIPYSVVLEIEFKLRKPYLSKDEEVFYILDNPICKDGVFKLPYIRSTTWKGALRQVVRSIAHSEKIVVRLFGNEKESEKARQGRLFFYPTFLNRIGLDVIAPLDRRKKFPVRGPILFEVAPEEAEGKFRLVYVPFDILNDGSRLKIEVQEDLEFLKETIPKMMLEYGFSTKKTSGYGVVEERIKGVIKTRLKEEKFEGLSGFTNAIDKICEVIVRE